MPGVRESNQRAKRRAPRCGALRVREDWPGFSTGLLPWRKGIGIHANAPLRGLIVQSSPPHRGPMRASAHSSKNKSKNEEQKAKS